MQVLQQGQFQRFLRSWQMNRHCEVARNGRVPGSRVLVSTVVHAARVILSLAHLLVVESYTKSALCWLGCSAKSCKGCTQHGMYFVKEGELYPFNRDRKKMNG